MSARYSCTRAAYGKQHIQLSRTPLLLVEPDRFSDLDWVAAEENKHTAPERRVTRPASGRTFSFACPSASDGCRTPDCRNTQPGLRSASNRPHLDVCASLCDRCTYGPECRSSRVLSQERKDCR